MPLHEFKGGERAATTYMVSACEKIEKTLLKVAQSSCGKKTVTCISDQKLSHDKNIQGLYL